MIWASSFWPVQSLPPTVTGAMPLARSLRAAPISWSPVVGTESTPARASRAVLKATGQLVAK